MTFFAAIGEVLFILFGVWLCLTGLVIGVWRMGRFDIEALLCLVFGLVIIFLSLHFGVIHVGVGG